VALAEVSTLYETNRRDIPEMLRGAADNIELEPDHPDCSPTKAVVVVQASQDGQIEIYAWGDTNDHHAIAMLERAKHKVLLAMNEGCDG
jgi:hypothetical protein